MKWTDKADQFRPRFEIRSVDQKGDDSVRVYGVEEMARNLDQVDMPRRGFFKLSLFAQGVAAAAVLPRFAHAQDKVQVSRNITAMAGIIAMTDELSEALCIQEASTGALICLKVVPPWGNEDLNIKPFAEVKVEDPAVFIRAKNTSIKKGEYYAASIGVVEKVYPPQMAVCVKKSTTGKSVCVSLSSNDKKGKDIAARLLAKLRPGSPALFMERFKINNHDDIPMVLRVVYLKNGGVIECQDSWVEGGRLFYRLGFGTMSIALSQVDLEKSFWHSVQVETKHALARQSGTMGRRQEQKIRKAAAAARKELEEELNAKKKAEREAAAARAEKDGKRYEPVEGRDDCDKIIDKKSRECTCVPICY